ncbi:MAG TPA: hypothetical protein VFM23_08325, partial [Gemmatimonadales bacterium]|nr:hypothetical protein [Gemmatimonadales bacterium]
NAALDNLGFMAADWITQGLAQTGIVEIVPSISMMSSARHSAEQGGLRDAAALRELGQATGAGTVVTGGYYQQGDSVRFQVQIMSSGDGRVLRALDPVVAPSSQPLGAVESLRQRVMATLATLFDSRLNRWATTATQPPTFTAYQEFIAGLDRFAAFDPAGAAQHFENAARVDTAFKLPLIFAANSYMNVGNFAKAESLGHVVERDADRLAPLDRAYLGWVLAVCRGDAEAAFQSSRRMIQLAPGSDAVYLFAGDAMQANRPREALNALLELDPNHGFTHGWWVYWQDRTMAWHMIGDHRGELKDAEEAMHRFPDNIQIMTAYARALAALGRTADLHAVLTRVENLDTQLDVSPADAMLLAALELRAHGMPAAADSVLAQTQTWLDARAGADSGAPAHHYLKALTAYSMGHWDDARREFERLTLIPGAILDTHGWLNTPPERFDFVGYLGVIAARQQYRAEAQRRDDQLAALKRPYLYGRQTMWRARIRAALGEREAAMGLIRDALRQGYPHGHTLHADLAFESLRSYPPYQALLKPKN